MESGESEEAELLKRFLAGDEDAKRVLLEKGYDAVKGHLRPYTRTADEAASLAMSAIAEFLKGKRKGKYDYLDSLKRLIGLLRKIGERRLGRRLERSNTQKRGSGNRTQSLVHAEQSEDERPTGDAQVEAADLMAAVMARLPDYALRETLKMHLDDKTKAEIARAFDVSERTIYNRLERIEEVLKEFREEAKPHEPPAD